MWELNHLRTLQNVMLLYSLNRFYFCRDLNSVIVSLDEYGHLYCSYLGTDPSLFVAPPVEARDVNYEVCFWLSFIIL